LRESWSPRWRGHICRPVAEEMMTLRLDRTLRFLLANTDQAPVQTISRAWSRGELLIATCQMSVIRSANGRVAVQINMQIGATATTQTIDLDWSTQRLGGRRAWWRCPGCGGDVVCYIFLITRKCAAADASR
jgi:hypothetical protein